MAGVGTAAGPTTRNLSRCPQEERGDSADRGVWVLVNRARVVVPAVMVLPHMSAVLTPWRVGWSNNRWCRRRGTMSVKLDAVWGVFRGLTGFPASRWLVSQSEFVWHHVGEGLPISSHPPGDAKETANAAVHFCINLRSVSCAKLGRDSSAFDCKYVLHSRLRIQVYCRRHASFTTRHSLQAPCRFDEF